MRILSSYSVIQSSTLCDLLQNEIMKVVKEFDIRKQKGESYDIRIILTESQEEVARIFRVVVTPEPSSYIV